MSNPATPALLDTETLAESGLVKIRQGYGMQRVYRLRNLPAPVPDTKVRIDIERNAYDEQSHYRAEIWTGTAWSFLTKINAESLGGQPAKAPHPASEAGVTWMPSYVHYSDPGRRALLLTAVETVASRLLADARAILS